jgi:putative colanic acid biosynthesis UDP-glucose lipid carrier transferase
VTTSDLFKNSRIIQYISDILVITALLLLFIGWQYRINGSVERSPVVLLSLHYKALLLLLCCWFFIAGTTNLYELNRFSKVLVIFQKLLLQVMLFAFPVFLISAVKEEALLSFRLTSLFLLSLFVCLLMLKQLKIWIMLHLFRQDKNVRRIVFIGENRNTKTFKQQLESKNMGLVNYGHFKKNVDDSPQEKVYKLDNEKLFSFIIDNGVEEIYFSHDSTIDSSDEEKISDFARKNNIHLRLLPETFHDNFGIMRIAYFDFFPVIICNSLPLDNLLNRIVKHVFDFVLALLAVVFVLSWLVPIISIAILIDSGRPVFYLQDRIGFNGKRFKIIKFRTMRPNSANDIKNTSKNDPRITKIGAFIRRTSLDELPQFFNVLMGNMSLVGPRPHMVFEDEFYEKNISKYYIRHYVPPGITGVAQANGLRSAVEDKESMIQRITADIYYIRNWTLVLDFYIVVKTFFSLFKRDAKVW